MKIATILPYKENYTHVLGYVSQANENDILSNKVIKDKFVQGLKVGKSGLEKSFETSLIGDNSIERYEVNAYGRRINQLAFQTGEKGKTIKLTIDTESQKLANELLIDKAGSICVMDIFPFALLSLSIIQFISVFKNMTKDLYFQFFQDTT